MSGRRKQKPAKLPRADVTTDFGVDEPGPRPVVVFILFETAAVSLETVEPALAKQTILGMRAIATPSGRAADATDSFATEIGKTIVAAQVMPAPYPAGELDFAITSSWMWPPGTEASVVRTARSHVLLVVTGGTGSIVENHLVATAVATLIAKLPGAVGVYWPAGSIVHHPGLFVALAAEMPSPEEPPLYLWINFHIVPNTNGTATLFTTGLAALALMEMEMQDIRMEAMDLREWASSLVMHQLEHGPVLGPGDTIGENEEAQLGVSHTGSSFGLAGTILQLRPL